jgi:hypothetical protein
MALGVNSQGATAIGTTDLEFMVIGITMEKGRLDTTPER